MKYITISVTVIFSYLLVLIVKGVEISENANPRLTGNKIYANTVTGMFLYLVTTTQIGIRIFSGGRGKVLENFIYDNLSVGINIIHNACSAAYPVVRDNKIYRNHSYGIHIGRVQKNGNYE